MLWIKGGSFIPEGAVLYRYIIATWRIVDDLPLGSVQLNVGLAHISHWISIPFNYRHNVSRIISYHIGEYREYSCQEMICPLNESTQLYMWMLIQLRNINYVINLNQLSGSS